MQLVLDANEFIFALGSHRRPQAAELLDYLIDHHPAHRIRIARSIIREVERHLSDQQFRLFHEILTALTAIDEDFLIPFPLGATYEAKGLKPGDAFIGAYTEWAGAEALVTENRHFLSKRSDLPFRVLTAADCLRVIR